MSESRTIYEFSGFRVDTANKTLQRGGTLIPLTPKVFDTLLLLLENAGTLVEKDVLMEKIWRDSFVEESNLTFNIKMLRKALGDNAGNPTFIENVPRRGYRFIANVKETDEKKITENIAPDVVLPISQIDADKPYKRSYFLPMGATLFLLIIGFTFFYRNSFFNRNESFLQINVSPVTATGRAFYAIISPDGKYIIHAKEEGGEQSLWIRQSDQNRDIEIVPPTEGQIFGLSVSPDSKSVYYTLSKDFQPDAILYQVPILGGASRQIISNIDSGISFSGDGTEFAFYRTNQGKGLSQLMIANLDGTNQRIVAERTFPETFETEFGDPVWKPDERKILAIAASNAPDGKCDVVEIEIETGQVKPFVQTQWKDIQQIAWLKKNQSLLLVALDEQTNSKQIWHINPTTGKHRKVTNDLSNYRGISLSNDERTLITTQTQQTTKLLRTKDKTAVTAEEILSEKGAVGEDEGMAWTANNELILSVGEHKNDNISILDQSGLRPITFDANGNRQPTVCGDKIVYVANFVSVEPNKLRLWKIGKDGKNPQKLTTDEGESEMYPHCSPNSDWVVYQKGWEKTTLWKVSIAGGESIQLTKTLSFQPNISPDGKMVAFYRLENYKWSLVVISMENGKILKEFPILAKSKLRYLRWTPDGKNLAFSDTRGSVSNIWLQPLAGGEPTQLTNFNAGTIFYFDWSPNGENLAYAQGTLTSEVFSIIDVR